MHKLSSLTIAVAALLMLTACGGAEPTPTTAPMPDDSSGDNTMTEAELDQEGIGEQEAEADTTEPAAPATGPAQLTVVTKVGSDVVSTHIKVRDESGAVIAEGESGTALTVQAGALTIEAKIDDVTVMADTPSVRHEVTVAAGAEVSEDVHFPRARVKTTVTINGKPDTKAQVTLMRNGAAVVTITSGAPDFVSITPGRFSAVIKARNAEITVPDVVIPEDASRNIPLSITL